MIYVCLRKKVSKYSSVLSHNNVLIFIDACTGEKDNKMNHFDRLPRELLEKIFDNIDAHFVCSTCSLVCRDWHLLTSDQHYWHSRCTRFNITIPPLHYGTDFNYAIICVYRPFGRNLLVNGDLTVTNPSADHFAWLVDDLEIEEEAYGADCSPSPSRQCFVASYRWGTKAQVLRLSEKIGFEAKILKRCALRVTASEMIAARWDCAAKYRLQVFVEKGDNEDTDEDIVYRAMTHENEYNEAGEHNCEMSELIRADANTEEGNLERRMWHQITQTKALTRGTGRVHERCKTCSCEGQLRLIFVSKAKDMQFWAGNYGMKMTNASLVIDFDEAD